MNVALVIFCLLPLVVSGYIIRTINSDVEDFDTPDINTFVRSPLNRMYYGASDIDDDNLLMMANAGRRYQTRYNRLRYQTNYNPYNPPQYRRITSYRPAGGATFYY